MSDFVFPADPAVGDTVTAPAGDLHERRLYRDRLHQRQESTMSPILIVLIVLLVLVIAGLPVWPYGAQYQWGYGPSGALGLLLIVILILFLFGYRF